MDFNPSFQKSTDAQVWIRLYGFNWALWHLQILDDIARGVEVPLKFDITTINRDFRHYARILVDVNLASSLPEFVLLDMEGMEFEVEIFYENLHLFCTAYKNIGHALSSCKLVEKQC